jgi:hypothetical protein
LPLKKKDLISSLFKTPGVVIQFSFKVVLLRHGGRAAYDHRFEGDDPFRDGPRFFQNKEAVIVSEGYDGIRRFFHTFDKVRVDIKLAAVESGKFYHDTLLP